MPLLHNPHPYDLYSAALGDIVKAGDKVKITVEQAKKVSASGIWHVLDDVAGDVKKDAVEVAETVAAPVKKASVKRGAKVAEVTAAPEMETR